MFPINEEDHWYRLVVRVLNNGVLDGPHDIENIDPTFTSKLQSSNLILHLFSINSGQGAQMHIGSVYPPSYTNNMEFWDIGYINPLLGKFINLNGMSKNPLDRKTHSKYFMKMLQQFNSLPNFNVKKEFQFNLVNGVFKFDDFFMTHSLFIDVLKDMELVKDDKESDLHKFYEHIANACKSVLGEVSLKKLKNLLEPHIGTKLGFSPSKTMN